MAGTLFTLATPLGNLDDLSPRALQTLREVDEIACEDTRRTRKLLERHGIAARTVSYHKFNESSRLEPLLARLEQGSQVALVSDAGTPGVADPGAMLVRQALTRGIRVCPIPGPSAIVTLLSASGLSGDRFVFDGYLPHRAGERRRRLRELAGERRTLVLFETPHRILEALGDIEEVLGPRRIVLGRELTKRHESLLCGTAAEVSAQLGDDVRGEITLVLAGADAKEAATGADGYASKVRECWQRALREADGDRRLAQRRCCRELGLKRAELYRLLTEIGEE